MFGLVKKENQIQTRDIKKYLVDEYERANAREDLIHELREQIEKLNETAIKYQATLVTLEEYKNRLDKRENEIKQLERKLEDKTEEILKLNENINDEKIKEYQYYNQKEKIEVIVKEELIQKLDDIKGHLTKEKIANTLIERS